MTKIYTRTGDSGQTGLIGGERVSKDNLHVAAFGTVDELNAMLGIVRAEIADCSAPPADVDPLVAGIQHRLFDLGAELATTAAGKSMITADHVAELEAAIDRYDEPLPPLREFILPGGSRLAAELHLARTVCRRAERLAVTLSATSPVEPNALRYLNRLSDLLFVLARSANAAAGVADVTWKKV
jgi:cob(I)alamin adenosyltransferase